MSWSFNMKTDIPEMLQMTWKVFIYLSISTVYCCNLSLYLGPKLSKRQKSSKNARKRWKLLRNLIIAFRLKCTRKKKVRGIFRHVPLLKLKAKLYFIDTLDTFKFLVCHEKQWIWRYQLLPRGGEEAFISWTTVSLYG